MKYVKHLSPFQYELSLESLNGYTQQRHRGASSRTAVRLVWTDRLLNGNVQQQKVIARLYCRTKGLRTAYILRIKTKPDG